MAYCERSPLPPLLGNEIMKDAKVCLAIFATVVVVGLLPLWLLAIVGAVEVVCFVAMNVGAKA